jgi:hypothetical protein
MPGVFLMMVAKTFPERVLKKHRQPGRKRTKGFEGKDGEGKAADRLAYIRASGEEEEEE